MNESGIYPSGDRVLILPDEVEETYGESKIVIVNKDAYQIGNSTGVLVAVGPDAWIHHVDKNSEGTVTNIRGYKEPMACVGDRVIFVKYSGNRLPGKDGKEYRIINDQDILARCDKEIDLVDFKPRKQVGR